MWHCSAVDRSRIGACFAVVMVLLVSVSLLVGGCGESTADKQKEYKAEYTEIINAFEARQAKDDAEAQKLFQSNNAAGLIKLNNQRMAFVSDTFDRIAQLYPPENLRRVQAETLYYLIAVMDQLQAQNDYFEAVLAGKPSTDLQSIAASASTKAQSVGGELGLDLDKANITIKSAPSSTQSQPQSVPSSSGGGAQQ